MIASLSSKERFTAVYFRQSFQFVSAVKEGTPGSWDLVGLVFIHRADSIPNIYMAFSRVEFYKEREREVGTRPFKQGGGWWGGGGGRRRDRLGARRQ